MTRACTCPYAPVPPRRARPEAAKRIHGCTFDRLAVAELRPGVDPGEALLGHRELGHACSFNLLAKDGSRLKQQYVSEKDQTVVERAEMVKGYEFEKDRFVIFQPDELKALEESPSHTIDIVAFIPAKAVDPIYYDKAYFLAPDKRGGKPYAC